MKNLSLFSFFRKSYESYESYDNNKRTHNVSCRSEILQFYPAEISSSYVFYRFSYNMFYLTTVDDDRSQLFSKFI